MDRCNISGLWRNLVPVIAGNILGGSVLVALVYYVIYRRPAEEFIRPAIIHRKQANLSFVPTGPDRPGGRGARGIEDPIARTGRFWSWVPVGFRERAAQARHQRLFQFAEGVECPVLSANGETDPQPPLVLPGRRPSRVAIAARRNVPKQGKTNPQAQLAPAYEFRPALRPARARRGHPARRFGGMTSSDQASCFTNAKSMAGSRH